MRNNGLIEVVEAVSTMTGTLARGSADGSVIAQAARIFSAVVKALSGGEDAEHVLIDIIRRSRKAPRVDVAGVNAKIDREIEEIERKRTP